MNRFADRVVVGVCAIVSIGLYTHLVWEDGFTAGRVAPRKCASVEGKEVVSTTAETCTYANSYGRATNKRRAG